MTSRLLRRPTAVLGATLGVAAAALLAAGVAPSSAAAAAPAVKFLSAAQLPQGERYGEWDAGAVKPGLGERGCLRGVTNAQARHRVFRTDVDAGAVQIVARMPDQAGARSVLVKTRRCIENVAADFLRDSQGEAGWRHHGAFDVEDGLSVRSTVIGPPDSEYNLDMYGVGRDGSLVTYVQLEQGDRLQDAPVQAFTKTAKVALRQLR